MLKPQLIFILFLSFYGVANATDQQQAAQLKGELEFDVQRRNDFSSYKKQNGLFEKEREKGLSLFLEEQEKWDITREKGIAEQRALRAQEKHMDESGPEYQEDLRKKMQYEKSQEVARKRHVQTRDQIQNIFQHKVKVSEEDELDIYNDRPRYSLRARGKNKWVSQGSKSGGSSGSSGSSGFLPSPGGSVYDYPPPQATEYVPTDNFEELPPPPPMMPYDSYGNPNNASDPEPFFNEGGDFGAPPPSYPPPPPEGGWDF